MRRLSRAGNAISSKIGKAIGDYNLIEDGDRILVAVSGGKDSLTLLKLLKERQKWAPVSYGIVAAHIRTDFVCSSCVHHDILEKFFRRMDVEYVFDSIRVLDRNGKTSCFWCSWNRRKALFEMSGRLRCNKVAFGHHQDDIIETMLLNLFFQGEFSAINPRQELFNGNVTIIRPLCYVEEHQIEKFAKENGFSSQRCRCPFTQDSNRNYIKEFIRKTKKRAPDLKTNIFRNTFF